VRSGCHGVAGNGGRRGTDQCTAEAFAFAAVEFFHHQVEEGVHLVLVVPTTDERGRVELDLADVLRGQQVVTGEGGLHAVQEIIDLVLVVAASAQGRPVERHDIDDERGQWHVHAAP
jgi:hypothetical protein